MMNREMIDKNSALFGLFDDKAMESKRVAEFQELFREQKLNAFYIPMNIRSDDLYFTLNGLKDSQIAGVNIGLDYKKEAVEQLDYLSDEVKIAGFVDSIKIEHKRLYGFITVGKAITNFIENGSRIGIFGSGALAKSIVYNLDKRDDLKEVTIIQDRVESALKVVEIAKNIDLDIVFSNSERAVKSSFFDYIIDATQGADLNIDFDSEPTLIAFKNSKLLPYSGKLVSNDEIRAEQNLIDIDEWINQ